MSETVHSQRQKACVLIIDDSPMELRATSLILSTEYDVLLANSGKRGFALAGKNRVDLILLDLNMPELNGFEILKMFKEDEDLKNIPIILVTGSESSADEVRGLSLGASDFIRKPFIDIVVKLRVDLHLQLQEQIRINERYSLLDGLTGIGNRRHFDKRILAEFRRAARSKEPLGLLMLDIDHFKKFNDRFGHINGDSCLKVVAEILTTVAGRGTDQAFRWGGEEFVVLLASTPLDGVRHVAEALRSTIEKTPIKLGNETAFTTISIGAGVSYPTPCPLSDPNHDFFEDIQAFLRNTNKALHEAKANGRNRVEFFCPTGN